MKHNIELLKADIMDELQKLKKIHIEYVNFRKGIDEKCINNTDKIIIGYYLHNFYNGCENIFKQITLFFENDLSPDSWHKDLLKRMKLNINGFRPAVINENLFSLLNDFRAFRHIFRYTYSFELRWDKMKLVADKFDETWNEFHNHIISFLNKLNDIR